LKVSFNNEKEYYNFWSKVIKKERECEIKYFKNLIKNVPLKKREKEGFSISNLKAKKIPNSLKLIYRFGRNKEIDTEIKIGDTVIVYFQELENEKDKEKIFKQGIFGVLENKGKKFLDISFNRKLPKSFLKRKLVVSLFISEITFKRMIKSLEKIKEGETVFDFDLILT